MISPQQPEQPDTVVGTLDGVGAGDLDQPFRFGWRPRTSVPYPFNTRQYARLLLLRSRVQAGLIGVDDLFPSAEQGAESPSTISSLFLGVRASAHVDEDPNV
jgi:hypothetical protein